MRRLGPPALLALPALCLALAGLLHPHHLTYDTSQRWFALHIPGLLVFPLVGVALAALVRLRTDLLAWGIRTTAYVYATFYTALDVISGVAAGYVTHELGPGVPRPEAVSLLFGIGTPLGEIGSWALLACGALTVVDQVVRNAAPGAVALLLLAGAWLVHVGHIFAPEGVAGMALLALGTAGVALVDATRRKTPGRDATSGASRAS
ncbi:MULTISPECIES: hypothetical protein [unclassified Nocardioides]|uniref:hypothetical protein n=1 Tax=unclassified Nocardioides TaxID=2615069 RepID=UPI0009EFAC85|nr:MULTISPECIES: hypothetical protein [unclassified Nocardioides]GAW50516.1 uncharacterized protein PD653B2_2851 [Nocardioides sp. PD653-B2]GAW56640.1 uncharacterized protein PD653_4077 [Nocardioides sp. PD653]